MHSSIAIVQSNFPIKAVRSVERSVEINTIFWVSSALNDKKVNAFQMEKTHRSNILDMTSGRFEEQYCDSDFQTFEPSIRVLKRVLAIMLSENGKSRTALAQQANLNYCRLSRHIEWLERKNFARLIVKEGKVKVILTETGVLFAVALVGKSG